MTNALSFFVPGVPVAKGRARATIRGGFARMYTPAKTVKYEERVAAAARQAMGAASLLEGPVSVSIYAVWPIPASWSKKRASAALFQPMTSKPDCDNLAKSVLDSCNGVVFKDDAAVWFLDVRKTYGEVAGLTVEVIAT